MRHIALAALACAALFGLSSCDDDTDDTKIYPTIEACRAEQSYDSCDKAFAEAKAAHERDAPVYVMQGSCEAVYGPGNCVPRGDSQFVPAMMGFMMGRMTADSGRVYVYQPVYRSYSNTLVLSSGASIGTYSPAAPGRAATVTVNRGGFGAVASSMSSGTHVSGVGSVSSGSMMGTSSSVGSVARGGFGSTAAGHASAGE